MGKVCIRKVHKDRLCVPCLTIDIYSLIKFVDYESRAKFRFKPCCLGGHDVAAVGNIHQLFHRHREQREGHSHFAGIDTAFQFAEATDAADEVNALVATQVGDAENIAENEVILYWVIKDTDRVIVVICTRFCSQRIPLAAKI